MKNLNVFIWLVLLLFYTPAYAVVVQNLFTGIVPISGDSSQVYNQAFRQALIQVLAKASGNSVVRTLPGIQKYLDKSSDYVQNYKTVQQDVQSGSKELLLFVQFNQTSVLQILRSAKQSLWLKDRPMVLLWVDISMDDAENLIASTSQSDFRRAILQAAQDRGLPVMFPLMDLQDLNGITSQSVSTLQMSVLLKASERYSSASACFAGHVYQRDGLWASDWVLHYGGNVWRWHIDNHDIKGVLSKAVNLAADQLANSLSVLGGQEQNGKFSVSVANVQGIAQYEAVLKYLRDLDSVSNIEVRSVKQQTIVLAVTANVTVDMLFKELTAGKVLLCSKPSADAGSANLLCYYVGG